MVATVSGLITALTFILPTDLSFSTKLIIILSLLVANLLFYLYTIIKECTQINSDYKNLTDEHNTLIESANDLKKKHEALAEQFTNKNNELDNLELKLNSYNLLFGNVNSILHYFISQPSIQEISCIEKVIKYLNDNHIKE
ncbi:MULTISPECIES: hypothetical protein [Clostridium]|uniref:hypothetical protein n=1 Tax=Clostridium TaxID=1485 RepID=UPI0005C1303D|nr:MULTISPECIES: hypothetical protein [Clostridium]KIU07711.1 hypothetical protein SC08_Contig83orf01632 [Clostridium butyricum]MBA8967541.1 uncharacterized protein YlxW (UPF0749 family) [Clostridium butyricum]MBA8971392.1 uncharacterized protein YlxW (UPF0749 family) [Clostridium butyricum]MBC2429167.1 hypothetical protein [Clostridium butyricum]MBO1685443.1 hypothetical protein [Clostridium butyricum]